MSDRYDVIIVGSGVGGIIAGCYLAKHGVKTLIIEKHDKPGGYCSSFYRRKFLFDTGVHYLSSVRKGVLKQVFDEIGFDALDNLNQFDPVDKIITPDLSLYIRSSLEDTILSFEKAFKKERNNICRFFNYISRDDFIAIYSEVKNMSFEKLLNNFFTNYKLKIILLSFVSENLGSSPGRISALASIVFLRQHLFDPGYYPKGGMLTFARKLVDLYRQYGGEIRLRTNIEEILVKNNAAVGVRCRNQKKILSNFVVSNVDVSYTFKNLIKCKTKEREVCNKIVSSSSFYAVFIGIKKIKAPLLNEKCDIWKFNTYKISDIFYSSNKYLFKHKLPALALFLNNEHDISKRDNNDLISIGVFVRALYETKEFWDKNRSELQKKILHETKEIFSVLCNKNICHIEDATPHTFYKYTNNREGAAFGLEASCKQIKGRFMPARTSIDNLLLTGHWTTSGLGQSGIQGVSVSGRRCAENICNIKKVQWKLNRIKI